MQCRAGDTLPRLENVLCQSQTATSHKKEPNQHFRESEAALSVGGANAARAGHDQGATGAAAIAQGECGWRGSAGGAEPDGAAVDGYPLPGGQGAVAKLHDAPRRDGFGAGQRQASGEFVECGL